MKAYLDILKKITDTCTDVRRNRTGIPDIGLANGAVFEHDMNKGFPLLTTKKMGLKNIATELEFFIKGITDKKWLQDRRCKIWNEWANPIKVQQRYDIEVKNNPGLSGEAYTELKNKIIDDERDVGPIYGWQWRHFGGEYQWDEARIDKDPTDNFNHDKPGVNQLEQVIYKLKNQPTDRRMIVSAWNPVDIPKMGLPACHLMHQLIVRDGKISLTWVQRSCDMFLGVPYNIASYALLLLLYAKESGYQPHLLKGELHDAHIYMNHIDQVKEQLARRPKKLPIVEIPDENWNGMLNWKANDFILRDYICHEAIKGAVAR
ncbi:MAG: thymidylate synthase [Rickettsiales bacterium]|jgi:thymidylate synthase|nr:thymidylate synthase [Rickettsiales bacterium]